MKTTMSLLLALVIIASLCFACTKSTPNFNDSTLPTVEFKVKKNNQYEVVAAAEISQSTEPLELMCLVTDKEGVRSIKLEYFGGTTKDCHNVTGDDDFFDANASVTGLPAMQQIILQGDASDKVSNTLPLYSSVSMPKCMATGLPLNHTFIARCTGQNWFSDLSKNQASMDLQIKVNP